MTRTSPSPALLRRASVGAVLRFAWDAEVFTASDVMGEVALTRSTTIDVLDELVERGLLVELENARAVGDYRKGRPARRFEFRARAGAVVGVDAGAGHLTVTVADLRGATLGTAHLTVHQDSETSRRRAAARVVDTALRHAGLGRADVTAICIGVPAPVDAQGRSPQHRNDFWRRMNPDFAELFGAWAPIARVENDASLAAVAERTLGSAVDCDDFVTLLAGERLGAGVWVDGRLLRGAHGGAAEMVAFDHVTGVEGAWGLGHRLARLAREAVIAGTMPPSSALATTAPDQIDGRTVLALARDGDEGALEIAHQVGETLAVIAAVFGSLFDSRRIIVCGAVAAGAAPVIEAAVRSLPAELDLPAPSIVASTLGPDIVSIGAVAAAVEAAKSGVLDLAAFTPSAVSAHREADAAP